MLISSWFSYFYFSFLMVFIYLLCSWMSSLSSSSSESISLFFFSLGSLAVFLYRACLIFPLHFNSTERSFLPSTFRSVRRRLRSSGFFVSERYFYFSYSVISIWLYSLKIGKGFSASIKAFSVHCLKRCIGASSA